MNEHMRRYLDEEWEADEQDDQQERDQRPPKREKALRQRQQEKERGKGIAKFVRTIKQQRKSGKP